MFIITCCTDGRSHVVNGVRKFFSILGFVCLVIAVAVFAGRFNATYKEDLGKTDSTCDSTSRWFILINFINLVT
jgi:hypothetical protein